MLIKALCDYYDILARNGEVLPEGYSNVSIRYKIALTKDGRIDQIIDCQVKELIKLKNDKFKERLLPIDAVMPKRTEKPGIDSNIIEHRPAYIFGLNYENGVFTAEDKTGKAKKSHDDFVEKNLEFIKDMDSPVINAFREFLGSWNPEDEVENQHLLGLGKIYSSSNFVFCLTGEPDKLLHEDVLIKEKWEKVYGNEQKNQDEKVIAQCAVSGEKAEIARIHSKIKGVSGGLSTGSVLIGFNNSSENSYGNDQSYNSNVSRMAMQKYTEAFNYLLKDSKHKIAIDDITIVFWAMDSSDSYEDSMIAMLTGQSEKMDRDQTEKMLYDMMNRSVRTQITQRELENKTEYLDNNTDFYMVGVKPNSSRLAVKFLFHKKYGDILWNMAQFQKDMQISEESKPVSIFWIKKELVSPNSKDEKANPDLLTKLLESIIYGYRYPVSLLETMVRRVKIDKNVNSIRVGAIKAYISRNEKEEFKLALDKENYGQAYLCGRLFAVLEKLQERALGSLNSTIKDKYFSAAAVKPATAFPSLMRTAQYHLKKLNDNNQIFYNKLIGEIVDNLQNEFPDTLSLTEQGKFIIGYYQQEQDFYKKREEKEEEEK